eukprot:jgi/Botrbrau1/18258/Bobra.0682s0002.1
MDTPIRDPDGEAQIGRVIGEAHHRPMIPPLDVSGMGFAQEDEAVHIGQGWGSVNLGPGWASRYGTLWAKDLMCHFQAEDGWDGEWTRRSGTRTAKLKLDEWLTYVLVDRDFFAVHRKLPQKFAPRRVGPFKVLSSPGPNAYRLEFPDGYDRYHPTVNVNFLTPYRTADVARVRPPPPPPHLVNDHIEYEIGGIVDHKPLMDDRGRTLYDPDGTPHMQYLVRWKGYTPDDDTWEPLTNFTRCRQQVEQYRGSHGLPPLPPRGTIPRIRP